MRSKLKQEFMELLEKDVEFRYAVAGYLGLSEILKRLDAHGEELVKLREDMNEVLKRLDRHEEELVKLRVDMNELREDMNKLREDMNKLREDMNELRKDTNKGFELVNRRLDALGARWGLMTEEAFREGVKGLVERYIGLSVKRWTGYDYEGKVYGYPSQIEVDIVISDKEVILVEIKSHIRASDVAIFKRKAEVYERVEGRRAGRLLMITPYVEDKAIEASLKLGVEMYAKV